MQPEPRIELVRAGGKKPSKLALLGIVLGIVGLLCSLMSVLFLIVGQSTSPPMYEDFQSIISFLLCCTVPLLLVGGGFFAVGLSAPRRASKTETQATIPPAAGPAPDAADPFVPKVMESPKNMPVAKAPESAPILTDTGCEATLQVLYPGAFFLTDAKIDVFLDNQPIGVGSAKHGLDITARTTKGKHILALKMGSIRKKEYSLELPHGTAYEARLAYDRTWGNFTKELQLQPKPPKEDVNSMEGVRRLLQEHMMRLSKMFQGRPGEQETLRFIQRVVADDLLTFAATQISQKMPDCLAQKKASHVMESFGEWCMAITLCPWLTPVEVRANLDQGYLRLLDALTKPALMGPGGKNIAHWIYCSNGNQAAVHLTLIPNPQGAHKESIVVAQDLLTPQERQQVGLPALASEGGPSFVAPTLKPVPGVCFQCHKSLKGMAGGVYTGGGLMTGLEQVPYPCKSCGTHFCVNCIAKIKQENNNLCPYCNQNIGW